MQLLIDEVSQTYTTGNGSVSALSDVSLHLTGGQFAALQGPSGCGKSTLLLAAGGLLRPQRGHVQVDGHDLYELSPNARASFRAKHIGFVFQQFHLIPYVSVLDNVLAATLGLPAGKSQQQRQRALALIDRLGLSERLTHRPGQLSTGERQRTALARALLNEPTLILADEPTGNLDLENTHSVLQALADYCREGGTVLLATHDPEAAAFAKVVFQMDRGRLTQTSEGKVAPESGSADPLNR